MEHEITMALKVLQSGGTILYPTDTIWGIGCDPTNPLAIDKIYNIKKREDSKSMLVLVDSAERILSYVQQMPELAWDLIKYAEKPLTIIYDYAINLAPNLIPDGSIGIRVSKEIFNQSLIRKFNKPVVSTSANISGKTTPGIFSEIDEKIKNSVDYIVNWRREDKNPYSPSGIIKLSINNEIKVIRK